MSSQFLIQKESEEKLKSFNIVVNSYDSSSWTTGSTITNATYNIRYQPIIPTEELKRPYLVRIRFMSAGNATPTNTSIYSVNINFTSLTRTQQNLSYSRVCGLLAVNGNYLSCGYSDNPPVYLDNLMDIQGLNVTITDQSGAVVDWAVFPHYQMIVSFEQV